MEIEYFYTYAKQYVNSAISWKYICNFSFICTKI